MGMSMRSNSGNPAGQSERTTLRSLWGRAIGGLASLGLVAILAVRPSLAFREAVSPTQTNLPEISPLSDEIEWSKRRKDDPPPPIATKLMEVRVAGQQGWESCFTWLTPQTFSRHGLEPEAVTAVKISAQGPI